MAIFEYAVQKTFMQAIDIVDIGRFGIRCINDTGHEYYLLANTIMGKTSILSYGPIIPDIPVLLDKFNVSYTKIDYKEPKITKIVQTFINDPTKEISNVEEVVDVEFWDAFPLVKDCFENA